jgi:hypothetical protein
MKMDQLDDPDVSWVLQKQCVKLRSGSLLLKIRLFNNIVTTVIMLRFHNNGKFQSTEIDCAKSELAARLYARHYCETASEKIAPNHEITVFS